VRIPEQPVEPVDHPPTLRGKLIPSVRQEPEHAGVVFGGHPSQVGTALSRHGPRIDAVGLAPVASVELACTCGKRR
jgi:hypothetical protein